MTADEQPGFWGSFKRWARLKQEDLGKWPTTFRFPTDCKDAGALEGVTEGAARSRVIKAIRLLPGRRGVIDIEVDVYENHEAGRARSELKAMLPAGVNLIGGPTWGAGSTMG